MPRSLWRRCLLPFSWAQNKLHLVTCRYPCNRRDRKKSSTCLKKPLLILLYHLILHWTQILPKNHWITSAGKYHKITESNHCQAHHVQPTVSLSTPAIHLSNGARDGGSHFPGQPFGDKFFQNIQSKPPLQQLEVIFSCPIACHVGEEALPFLATASSQVVVTVQRRLCRSSGSCWEPAGLAAVLLPQDHLSP